MRERNSISLLSLSSRSTRSSVSSVASRATSFRILPLKHSRIPSFATYLIPETSPCFLLPCWKLRDTARCAVSRPCMCFACGLFRARNTNLFAGCLILRFSRRMIRAIKAASKLCADKPRHAQVKRLSAVCLRSTWQGGGYPLRCILPLCRTRPAETLPVSAPLGLCGAAAFRSWAVRP
jgi:hypothetical protein